MAKHKYTSLDSAVRKIRKLEQVIKQYEDICRRQDNREILLAKLATGSRAFFSPLECIAAENVRDEILKKNGRNPDGTFKPK